MSSQSEITITSLTVEPQILRAGQSQIRVDSTINYTGHASIFDFWVDLYGPDKASGGWVTIHLSPIIGTNMWTGTYEFPANYPDVVLSNFNACGFRTSAPNGGIVVTDAPALTVRLERRVDHPSQETKPQETPHQKNGGCNIMLSFRGSATIECDEESQSHKCQTRITISGPVTINCSDRQ